jgi:RNA polymerase sigma-70 factor (ECF subfamily)
MFSANPAAPDPADSFEARVREHQAGLRAFVRALGVDDAWVDDLAQEAFIVAYRRLADFEPDADFGRWLRGIARHLVANERHKDARRSRLLPLAVADVLLNRERADDPGPADLTRLVPVMQECVEQLPPRSRELLQRRYAGNEKTGTLARELRMKTDAVRQTLLRIRIAVKECIERKRAAVWL